jgi:hypothetical protein
MSETLENQAIKVYSADDVYGNQEKPAPQTNESETDAQEASGEKSEAQNTVNEESEDQGENGEGEEQESEASEDDAKDESGEPREKEQKGFGKRISKLVKKNQNMSKELEYWKEQAMAAKGQKPEAAERKSAPEGDKEPNPNDFESYEEFQRASIEYGAKKALGPALDEIKKMLGGSKSESEAEKASKTFEKRAKDFAKDHKDYAEAMKALSGIEVDQSVEQAILLSDHGPALLYELGKNPDLAEEIAELPPILQFKEIVKLEQKIEARKTAAPKTTKAPPPPKPVGSKSEGKKSIYDPSLSQAEYERLRREQIRAKQA